MCATTTTYQDYEGCYVCSACDTVMRTVPLAPGMRCVLCQVCRTPYTVSAAAMRGVCPYCNARMGSAGATRARRGSTSLFSNAGKGDEVAAAQVNLSRPAGASDRFGRCCGKVVWLIFMPIPLLLLLAGALLIGITTILFIDFLCSLPDHIRGGRKEVPWSATLAAMAVIASGSLCSVAIATPEWASANCVDSRCKGVMHCGILHCVCSSTKYGGDFINIVYADVLIALCFLAMGVPFLIPVLRRRWPRAAYATLPVTMTLYIAIAVYAKRYSWEQPDCSGAWAVGDNLRLIFGAIGASAAGTCLVFLALWLSPPDPSPPNRNDIISQVVDGFFS